jgi:hypothetical protein
MLPLIAGIVSSLLANNLPKIAQGVIDKGLDVVEEKLGVKLEPDMSPEKIAEIQAAAQKHEEFKIEQDNKNTADARDMQKSALAQSDVWAKRFVYMFISFWSIVAAVYIAFVTFGYVPPENVRVVDTLLGFIQGTIVATMFNYLLGSSNSSSRKTDLLASK